MREPLSTLSGRSFQCPQGLAQCPSRSRIVQDSFSNACRRFPIGKIVPAMWEASEPMGSQFFGWKNFSSHETASRKELQEVFAMRSASIQSSQPCGEVSQPRRHVLRLEGEA